MYPSEFTVFPFDFSVTPDFPGFRFPRISPDAFDLRETQFLASPDGKMLPRISPDGKIERTNGKIEITQTGNDFYVYSVRLLRVSVLVFCFFVLCVYSFDSFGSQY